VKNARFLESSTPYTNESGEETIFQDRRKDKGATTMRIGMGYDVHRLAPGRKLVLGGVAIPFDKGLLGHSDADTLVHAVIDALLGAAGLGDIGLHFPDTDLQFKDISSLKLLAKTNEMIRRKGYSIQNIDATIFAQAPKLSGFREKMQKNIARTIAIEPERINVKATTFEGLGMIGHGEGIAAMCVALLNDRSQS
jgi:2-C-methyl-D-erythritol 2,4-cyclodiphosphate synthase